MEARQKVVSKVSKWNRHWCMGVFGSAGSVLSDDCGHLGADSYV